MEGDLINTFKSQIYRGIFEVKDIFSREIFLNYKAISEQPWLYFNCLEKDKHSFKIHDLEMENESMLWHLAAQKDEKVEFEGFLTLGSLRGYLTVPEKDYKIGVVVESGRIRKLVSQKELEKTKNPFLPLILYSVSGIPKRKGA